MPKASSSLPPLEWLRVFAAAAEAGNFTAAAAELNLTQAAVSQRIRNLEARLGRSLFTRLPRGVELTADGEAYAPHVRQALAALERSTADLFSAPRARLSISGSASVIALWITPRLPELLARFPNLQVSFATVQRSSDYAAAQADLEIRFGSGAFPGQRARKLFDEVLVPVAAPALLSGASQDWRRLPQIALNGPRDGWREWAAAAAVPPPPQPRLRFDSFTQALTAAIAGQGVLLASLPLSLAAIENGSLRRLPERELRMEQGYWLTWSETQARYRNHDAIVSALAERDLR
ncbi:MAG: LysR substrate-binding domain-containing protein [Kiloniellales bacterium]